MCREKYTLKEFEVRTFVLEQEVYTNTVEAKTEKEAIKKAELLVKEQKQVDAWIDCSDASEVENG